ncbi:PEBP-like protein [Hygrophoropsis aurantiaca]|uniref:PEBP-like protein n=1 Tax=Hygrophoropsis aurantiaca TaxID=72124 RepID=A0ACB8A456_9AGAM|nr:PEBP-like protein [Hygrophoropsis aurantiaca]
MTAPTTSTYLDPLSAVTDMIQKSGIAPDVIPELPIFRPTVLLSASWGDGAIRTSLGNTLLAEQTKSAPLLAFSTTEADPDPHASYTLAITDPDAPRRGDAIWGPWRHWLVTGIKALAPGASTLFDVTSAGAREVTPYVGPSPPPQTGLHRYVLLLFKEPPSYSAPELGNSIEERKNWNAIAFAEREGLRLVGANFFYVEG